MDFCYVKGIIEDPQISLKTQGKPVKQSQNCTHILYFFVVQTTDQSFHDLKQPALELYSGVKTKRALLFSLVANSSLWAPGAILPLDQATIISIRNCADHPVIDQFSSRLIIGPLIMLTTD